MNPAPWKRHKQQTPLLCGGLQHFCEWRTIGPQCKVSAWLLTDLCMPSPRHQRLGTLPSLSFGFISSTNLLGAMKELNSFATLSRPKCHYHNVLHRPTISNESLLILFFMEEDKHPLTFTELSLSATLSARRTNSSLQMVVKRLT